MSNIPNIPKDLKYTDTHEWVRSEGQGIVVVGITDHAQSLLGDLVYVELPEVSQVVKAGEECGVVESVKAASDVFSPVSGKILSVNTVLIQNPEKVNHDPYGAGWLYRVHCSEPTALEALLDARAYTEAINEQEN